MVGGKLQSRGGPLFISPHPGVIYPERARLQPVNLSAYKRRAPPDSTACPGCAILDRMGREIRSKLCLDCGVRMKLVRELSWLGPGLPAVQLSQCGDCGHVEMVECRRPRRPYLRLDPVVRPLLTSRPTGNVIPWHAGSSSGSGSARPGLSQKGGLPNPARAFVGSRPPTRAPSP